MSAKAREDQPRETSESSSTPLQSSTPVLPSAGVQVLPPQMLTQARLDALPLDGTPQEPMNLDTRMSIGQGQNGEYDRDGVKRSIITTNMVFAKRALDTTDVTGEGSTASKQALQADEDKTQDVSAKRQKRAAPGTRISVISQKYHSTKTKRPPVLPIEMLHMVIEHTTSKRDLMSWALVSKGVLNVAQQKLYESLNHEEWNENPRKARDLRSTKMSSSGRLHNYVKSLVQNPRLATYVRNVSFGTLKSSTEYHLALGGDPRKTVLKILFEFRAFTGLPIHYRDSEDHLIDLILALCPNLECLTLGPYRHERLIQRYRTRRTGALPCPQFPGALFNIRTIRVSSDIGNYWERGLAESWMDDYFNLPSIETIHQENQVMRVSKSAKEENRSTVQTLVFINCLTSPIEMLDTLSRPKALRKFVFSRNDSKGHHQYLIHHKLSIPAANLGHALRLQKHSLKDIDLSEYEGFNPRARSSNLPIRGTIPIFGLADSVDDEYTIDGVLLQLGDTICDFSDTTKTSAIPGSMWNEKVGSLVDFDELERLSIPSGCLLGVYSDARYRLCEVLPRSLVHLRLHNLHYWVFVDVKRLLMEMKVYVPRLKRLELVVEEGMKREWGPVYKLAEAGRNLLMDLAEKMGVELTIDERY